MGIIDRLFSKLLKRRNPPQPAAPFEFNDKVKGYVLVRLTEAPVQLEYWRPHDTSEDWKGTEEEGPGLYRIDTPSSLYAFIHNRGVKEVHRSSVAESPIKVENYASKRRIQHEFETRARLSYV